MTNAAAPSTKKNPRAVRAAAAEGARQFDTSSVETSVALKDDGSFKHTHPLAWGLRGWSVLVVLSVLVEGTSNALRGAFVGAQEWVEWTNSASGFAAQAAAISTGMLLIYLGLMAVRLTRSAYAGIVIGLLGAGPTVLIFLAQRFILNQELAWMAAFLAALTMLLAAQQAATQGALRCILALAGLTMLTAVMRIKLDAEGAVPVVLVALGGIEVIFRWATLLAVMGRQVWRSRQRPWQSASLIGCAILLSASSHASTLPSAGHWQLIMGRTLNELAPHASFGIAGPLGFSVALLSVIWSLTTTPLSLSRIMAAVLALGVFAPTTPLTAAWLTVCAFTVVIICWSPQASQSEQISLRPNASTG